MAECAGSFSRVWAKPARAAKAKTTRAFCNRSKALSIKAKLSESMAWATSQAKVCGLSSARLCTIRAKALRSMLLALLPAVAGRSAPSAESTAETSSSCRPSARRRGATARMRSRLSPSATPQSVCNMHKIPDRGNSRPRGGQVARYQPTL